MCDTANKLRIEKLEKKFEEQEIDILELFDLLQGLENRLDQLEKKIYNLNQ